MMPLRMSQVKEASYVQQTPTMNRDQEHQLAAIYNQIIDPTHTIPICDQDP